MKTKGRPKIFRFLWIPVFLLLPLYTGCSSRKPEIPDDFFSGLTKNTVSETLLETAPVEETAPTPPDSYSQEEAFLQMLLFLQEGFRQHNIPNTYKVYFNEIEALDDGTFSCKMLLEDKTVSDADSCYWREFLTFSYDEETRWYTFRGEYEPVLAQDSSETRYNTNDAKKLLAGAVYEAELSINTDLQTPIRYFTGSGPIANTDFFHNFGESSYHKPSWIYTYLDERLDVRITIIYPRIFADDALEDLLNEKVYETFFHGRNKKEDFAPEKEMYCSIDITHKVTRKDKQFLSLLIYEYSSYRRAAHPADSYTALTLSLETGKALTLRDIVGEDCTMAQLLSSDAFHFVWLWQDDSEEEWMRHIRDQYHKSDLDTFNDRFYLTGDSLGLIVHWDDYTTCIEAKFADLGLDEWTTAPQEDK